MQDPGGATERNAASARPDPVVHGSIDVPVAGTTVATALVRVAGWTFDEAGLIDDARLVVDGGAGAPLRLGVWRPDVAGDFPAVAHAGASGFETTVDLRAAGPTARIAVIVRRGDGPWTEAVAVTVTTAPPPRERDGARRRAAFTIVHNEPRWLPLWLAHYGRFFDADDLFVLDHGSTDASTRDLAGIAHLVPVHRQAAFDHLWLKSVVQDFQAFLLRSYDLVLFAEADEFIIADPLRHAGLDAYLDVLEGPAARCAGFNVVHQSDEPPLDFAAALLPQRRCWHASLEYSKRLVARVPLRWCEGFHLEFNAPDEAPDPALMLVHMHRADYDTCLARHRGAAARDWSKRDIETSAGSQNRIVDPDAFEEWFRRGPDLDAPPELIPDHIRALL